MRGFVKALSVVVFVFSGFVLLLATFSLLRGGQYESAGLHIALALFGGLVGGVSWVLMDIAVALSPSHKAET